MAPAGPGDAGGPQAVKVGGGPTSLAMIAEPFFAPNAATTCSVFRSRVNVPEFSREADRSGISGLMVLATSVYLRSCSKKSSMLGCAMTTVVRR